MAQALQDSKRSYEADKDRQDKMAKDRKLQQLQQMQLDIEKSVLESEEKRAQK